MDSLLNNRLYDVDELWTKDQAYEVNRYRLPF